MRGFLNRGVALLLTGAVVAAAVPDAVAADLLGSPAFNAMTASDYAPAETLAFAARAEQAGEPGMALAALEMLATAQDIMVAGQQVRVQIGVHCGEVVAGVVGQKRPHYAVFGSSVCVASRMESTSQPEHVNISQTFHKCVITDIIVRTSAFDQSWFAAT